MAKQRMQIYLLVKKNVKQENVLNLNKTFSHATPNHNKIRATQHSCWTTKELHGLMLTKKNINK